MGQRHGIDVGWTYRSVVATAYPFMQTMTKQERAGMEYVSASYPPHDGVIIAANHMSWFDPLSIGHALWDAGRPPHFLAKDELFTMPGLSFIMKHTNQIPVYRETDSATDSIRDAIVALEHGETILIYPEGTMTRDEDFWMMTGRTGVAQLALASGAPIIPAAQWGPHQVMRPYRNEFKIFPRKTMVTHFGSPIDLSDYQDVPVTNKVLHEVTNLVVDTITEMLEEIRGEKAPKERLDFKQWRRRQNQSQPDIEQEEN